MNNLIRLNPFRWPYSLQQLREDEPSRSFSNNPTIEEYAHYNVYRFEDVVTLTEPPIVNPATHRLEQIEPVYVAGVLTQQWRVLPLTPEEAEAYYRLTHPPRWLEFQAALPPEVDQLLQEVLNSQTRVAMALSIGLQEASSGDYRLFLGSWQAVRQNGAISNQLKDVIVALAIAHDLPQEFIDSLV